MEPRHRLETFTLTGLPNTIRLLPLSGHADGHADVLLDTDDGFLLHVGDAAFHPASTPGEKFPRTRFTGRNDRSAPCDLVIPNASGAEIVVAAKGFDSTGSKLTDAVREIEEMAEVRTPRQFVLAVIDGIGWKNRASDLRKIHNLWVTHQIDGMYTLATLNQFHDDVEEAARLRKLL